MLKGLVRIPRATVRYVVVCVCLGLVIAARGGDMAKAQQQASAPVDQPGALVPAPSRLTVKNRTRPLRAAPAPRLISDREFQIVSLQPAEPSSPTSPPPPPPPPPAAIPPDDARPTPGAGTGRAGPIRVDMMGRVSIHTDNLDIRQALEILSRQANLNILISPGVQGPITINLDGVTIDQALDAILKLGNLSAKREGGLIYIFSPEEVLLQGDRGSLETRVYHLNYVRSQDIETMIRPFLSDAGKLTTTPDSMTGIAGGTNLFGGFGAFGGAGGSSGGGGGGGGATGALATGGNSLAGGDIVIVQDFALNLKTIDDIVRRLDIQPLQVMVEAVILSVALSRGTSLGINLAILNDKAGTGLAVFGNGYELSTNVPFPPGTTVNPLTGAINGDPGLGFPSPTNGVKYGFINKRVTGFIRALETIGEVNVLASPRVLVLNKQRAEVQLGQRLGYATVTQNLTSTVQQIQFLNTGTLLRFRPFISNDGMIRMEVHPEKSTGNVNPTSGLPSSNTSEVTTNVMVPDGATLVIGGLMENDDDTEQQGTLGLSKLPVVGPLFRQKTQTTTRNELIVMLTPRIWNQSGLIGNGTIPGAVCPAPMASAAAAPGATAAATAAPALARNTPGSPPQAARPPAAPATPPPAAAEAAPTQEADPAPSSNAVVPRRAVATPRTPPPSRANRVAENAPRDPGLLRASVSLTDDDPQPRPDSDPGYARHLVRRGENFWTIARRYYGSGGYYKALWAANRDQVAAPDQLTVGMAIVVPPASDLDPSLIEAPRPASAPARATPDERVSRTWSAVKSAPASALKDGSDARP